MRTCSFFTSAKISRAQQSDLCDLVRWQDANIAHIVGGKTYSHLGKNKSPLPEVKADKDQFLAGAALTTDSFAEGDGKGDSG